MPPPAVPTSNLGLSFCCGNGEKRGLGVSEDGRNPFASGVERIFFVSLGSSFLATQGFAADSR